MKSCFVRAASLSALLCCASIGTAAAATITFTDGGFSTWTSGTIFGQAAGQTVALTGTGGNPGAFLSVTTVTGNAVFTGFFEPTFVVNPAAGAITSIQFSIDYRNIASYGQGQAVALTVRQGSSYYRAGPFITGSSNSAWQSAAPATYTQASFVLLAGTGALDFSVNGAPISVGFSTGNSGGYGINVGYDNFNAVVTTVPVPAAAWLLGSALGLLGVARRRTAG